jgi:hypothetical protein
MTLTTKLQITVAGLVGAAVLSPVALAGGEPKNDWPFTGSIAERTPAQVQSSTQQDGAGEPKNQRPFTRPVSGGPYAESARIAGPASVGEAKNDLPFTQVVQVPVVGGSDGGFDWGDAGIGVGAGLGIAALVAGGLLLTYRGPRGRKIGAAATR